MTRHSGAGGSKVGKGGGGGGSKLYEKGENVTLPRVYMHHILVVNRYPDPHPFSEILYAAAQGRIQNF